MVIESRWTGRRHRSRSLVLSFRLLTFVAIALVAHAANGQTRADLSQPGSAGLAAPGNVGAPRDPWRFSPAISVEEIYTDNALLAPRGSERSDFITTIAPSLRVTRYGSRLYTELTYSPQFNFFANSTSGSDIRNTLNARLNAALIDNLLFFEAFATIYQVNSSPFGTLAADSPNGSANRSESRNYSLGPVLRSRFGNDLSYQAGIRYTGNSYDNSTIATSHTTDTFASFESGTTTRDIGFGANFQRSDQSYGGRGEIITETTTASLIYQLAPTLRARLIGGYDRNRYPSAGQRDLSGPNYSGGFEWNPSQHTSLSALVGHRYFGPTADIFFNASHQRWAFTASYVRDQTTSTSSGQFQTVNPYFTILDQALRNLIPDPAQRSVAVQNLLQQSGISSSQFDSLGFASSQLYLQKRLEASLALIGLRNTVTFNAARVETQVLSNVQTVFDAFLDAQRIRQTVFGIGYSYKLGPRTNAGLLFTRTHNVALSGEGDTKQRLIQASVTRQLGKRLTGTILVRNTAQSGSGSNTGNFFAGNYRENQIRGSLTLGF